MRSLLQLVSMPRRDGQKNKSAAEEIESREPFPTAVDDNMRCAWSWPARGVSWAFKNLSRALRNKCAQWISLSEDDVEFIDDLHRWRQALGRVLEPGRKAGERLRERSLGHGPP